MEAKAISQAVENWVASFVIDLNICPFAKREFVSKRIRFHVSESASEEALLLDLQTELEMLNQDSSIETTLLIHPNVLQDFLDYNQFLDHADNLIAFMQLEGVYQIASFHPQYRFSGTEINASENYTNRSPYPILHILREASVAAAVETYPDVDQIPVRNTALMNQMGTEKLTQLANSFLKSKK